METILSSFSNELTNLVQRISPSVVAVHARRHFPSSGVHWGPDLVVTADHTVAREEFGHPNRMHVPSEQRESRDLSASSPFNKF